MINIWIGQVPAGIKCWAYKRTAIEAGALSPRRIQFRFQIVWCDVSPDGISLKDGVTCPIHEYVTTDGQRIIGMRDREAARNTAHEQGWRESFDRVVSERIGCARQI